MTEQEYKYEIRKLKQSEEMLIDKVARLMIETATQQNIINELQEQLVEMKNGSRLEIVEE